MIEKGRHMGLDRALRLCPFCRDIKEIPVVEDEFHFFFECFMYHELRKLYFKEHWMKNISLDKFYSLMSSNDKTTIFSIARYLQSAFTLRTSRLYPI